MDKELIIYLGIGIFCLCLILFFIIISRPKKDKRISVRRVQTVRHGMAREDVLEILGEPTSSEVRGDYEIMVWGEEDWKGSSLGRTKIRNIRVVFHFGIVEGLSKIKP